ncbi:MAG TPA: hypothetical protein VII46_09530 [Acidimicrobiales bacterium]
MDSTEASSVGRQLDEHHAPETNGRMAICRKCGARTDGPRGGHQPAEHQVVRSNEWLIAQVRLSHIERAREIRHL